MRTVMVRASLLNQRGGGRTDLLALWLGGSCRLLVRAGARNSLHSDVSPLNLAGGVDAVGFTSTRSTPKQSTKRGPASSGYSTPSFHTSRTRSGRNGRRLGEAFSFLGGRARQVWT